MSTLNRAANEKASFRATNVDANSPLRERIRSGGSNRLPVGLGRDSAESPTPPSFGSPYFTYQHRKHLIQERTKQSAISYRSQQQQRSQTNGTALGSTSPGASGSGADFQWFDPAATQNAIRLTEENRHILSDLRKIMSLRLRYQERSLQRDEDNPKNAEGWQIYPPPKARAWRQESAVTDPVPRRVPDQSFTLDVSAIPKTPGPDPDGLDYALKEGHFAVFDGEQEISNVPSLKDFFLDLDYILSVVSDGPTKSFCYRRLSYLEKRFEMYHLLNEARETQECKLLPHRDFYNVRKVDTHVHLASCMNQKHLLRFIKSKIKKASDDIVIYRDGKHLTLQEVFKSLNLSAYDLSIDTLDMHANLDSFHRFDKFNLKYNPIGESRLREIFLKTDNYIKGQYLAEVTKEVISDLEASKYQHAEPRVSIYGRSKSEWSKLADWVVDNKVWSDHIRWLIQVPRLYNVYKASGHVENFEQMIDNVFRPLFEVTKDPSSNWRLHLFLQRVAGFDSVDDEGKAERRIHRKYPLPRQWDVKNNPPYSYYVYYMYANICALNQWRKRRGFNTFTFRPHAGEAGDTEHLASVFLAAHGISHGILLRKTPTMQYLYYLMQIGIAMSPISNNALWLTYERNPFLIYFKRGLNVSLSTDDPLQFHFTKEPLIEEFSVAVQIYKLSAVDMCELARNSVRQSGWESEIKKHWLGEDYDIPGPNGNEIRQTNIPQVRVRYRFNTYLEELQLVMEDVVKTPSMGGSPAPSMPQPEQLGGRDRVGSKDSSSSDELDKVQEMVRGLEKRSCVGGA